MWNTEQTPSWGVCLCCILLAMAWWMWTRAREWVRWRPVDTDGQLWATVFMPLRKK
jgi:hypothetical protein